MSETRMPRRVFLGYLGAAAVVGVADPRAFIKGLITPTTPSQQQGEQFPVAVEAHHGEEHENIVTDTIANLGVLRFGHALMTAAEQGHFSGQDWTEISAYLGAYLASLPSEKRNSEMSHLLRDTFILTAMVAGAYAGDAYLRAKEEMGLPTTMDIPGGYVVNEQVIDQILGSMRHEELV
ncbi:MAG TPA: hypothetical protein VGA67_02980, partial [Candidatus Dojkabacteria bacterium]